jgi:mono/diheme cytochrome c family protein
MHRVFRGTSLFVLVAGVMFALTFVARAQQQPADEDEKPRAGGWTIPADAAQETSPISVTPQTLVAGRALFQKNCQRCHGAKGVGDGPDADPDHMADMDLTNPKRASRNPDGVIFYKVWNGRSKPKMPAFKEKLSKEQVWTIIAYVQTLRKNAS